ncbi:RAB11-binding protein RELCH homolog isoform X2 [Oculina patagonica]
MLVLKSVKEEKANLEAEHAKLQEECKRLQEEIGELKYENHTLNETVENLESELREMANSSQTTVSASTSLIQNTSLSETSTDGVVTHTTEATAEEAIGNSHEVANVSERTDEHSEDDLDSKENVDTSEECVDGGNGTRIDDAEIDQGNTADVSIESTQERHDSPQVSPIPPSPPADDSEEKEPEVTSSRVTSSSFRDALLSFTHVQLENRLSNEVCKLSNADENVVLIVARCLPHIVPNVLLNKREELIPVILCSAIHHPEVKERDNLLHMLFNLIKRPDEDQRQMIMSGCAAFAQVVGPTRIEAELLPQWWEQIGHKYVERRLLVAEACGGLAPYLPDYIRSSLVWSMLKQMLSDDRNEAVREAVTKSLALVVAFIENEDKYEQAYELLVETLFDSSEKVAKTSMDVFLSSFAMWAQDLDKIESHLFISLISNLENTIKDLEQVQELANASEDIEKVHKTLETIQTRLPRCIQVITPLIPALFASVLRTAPFAKKPEDVERYNVPVAPDRFLPPSSPLTNIETIFGGNQTVAFHVRRFDKHVSEDHFDSWDSLSWIHYECLPNLCEIVGKVHVSLTDCVQKLILLFRSLCITFGKPYSDKKIKPFCMERLNVLALKDERRERLLSSASLPVLAAGVLGCFESEEDTSELTSLLRHSVIALAEASAPLDGPLIMYQELSTSSRYHDVLIGVLWEIVVHSNASVRCCAAPLFTVLMKGVDLDSISRKVLPALVTLASDSQMSVRTAAIPAFGAIVENVTDKTILEKVYVQFQSFLEDPQYKDQHELQATMIRTFGKVAPHAEPHFRDEVLLPRLVVMATINNQSQDEDRRREIALELMEAYVSLTCCFISIEVLNDYIIPGLRAVKQDIEALAPECEETVQLLLKECEVKADQKAFAHLAAGSKIGQEIKSTFISGFHRLKDAPRPKMADIFKKKDRFDS